MSWSAIAMALMPDRQTLLIVIEGTVIGMPRLDGRLTGGDLPGSGLDDLTHDDVVDLVTGDASPLEGGLDGDPAEVGGGLVLQASEQAADGGARTSDDHGTGHADLHGVGTGRRSGLRRGCAGRTNGATTTHHAGPAARPGSPRSVRYRSQGVAPTPGRSVTMRA